MSEPAITPFAERVVRPFATIEKEVLAQALPGYEPRPQQTAGAEFVQAILATNQGPDSPRRQGLVQAGTGTGKSFATLIPAIESGERTVIATATNALLRQYEEKDLPFLAEHMGVIWALLKGRSNYVCAAKLNEVTSYDVPTVDQLRKELEDPAHDGDKEKVATPVASNQWGKLTSTSDECPGRTACMFGSVCYAERAKVRAKNAQVVVTNQMMLATELELSSRTGIQLLGEYDQLIVDEAHELEDWVTKAQTISMTRAGLEKLASEVTNFLRSHQHEDEVGNPIIRAVNAVWEVFPTPTDKEKVKRLRTKFFTDDPEPFVLLAQALTDAMPPVRRVEVDPQDKRDRSKQERLLQKLDSAAKKLTTVVTSMDHQYVRYVERWEPRGKPVTVKLIACPVTVADYLRKELWSAKTAVLVSATLTAGGDFSYIKERLGLPRAETLDVGTSFDFPTQARLFVPPRGTPDIKRNPAGWQAYATETMGQLVEASDGGALLLFTGSEAMRRAHAALVTRLAMSGLTVLMQGEATNGELARTFGEDRNSVLFATRSFMTGVSFEGDTCRLVVVDKLPFPVPSEPVFEARSEVINEQYHDNWASFNHLSVPIMSLILQQAVGRLIRTKRDRGVMAVLDPRLTTMGYGKQIVASLPPATRLHSIPEVRAFFRS